MHYELLNSLAGQKLRYGIKSPDLELYDFGFGEWIERINRKGEPCRVGTLTLHAMCRFRVYWRDGRRWDFDGETSAEIFGEQVKEMIGLEVKRLWISNMNDLRIDFGQCRMTFITYDGEDESWRLFRMDKGDSPHLVASAETLALE